MDAIKMPHKICAYNCMWNPVEDLYTRKTGNAVPDFLFFTISGIGNYIYLKNKNNPVQRIVGWGNGHTTTMYDFMKDIAGFDYEKKEGQKFENAFKNIVSNLDNGKPTVLGALDMYHLPYFDKFYHKVHIPIHYIMAVGYDEEFMYVMDCDREGVQSVSYEDLCKAMAVETPGYSKKNTYFTFDFYKSESVKDIVLNGFRKKAEFNLNPPVSIFGIKGMKKMINEIGNWKNEISAEEYEKCLLNMVEFSGFPPILPEKLSGFPIDEKINHMAGRDALATVLTDFGEKNEYKKYVEAGRIFSDSGKIIEEVVFDTCDCILQKTAITESIVNKMTYIIDNEEKAYELLLND